MNLDSNKITEEIKHDWSKSHNGVMLCTIKDTMKFMPETVPMLKSLVPFLEHDLDSYLVDVKVHMLMPDQYPCIPNWHRDFVPRGYDLKQDTSAITGDLMYIWISGAPFTEYKTTQGKVGNEHKWTVINQNDFHRGVKSEIHTWRCFIRVIPKWFVHPTTINIGTLRRHSQIYIDKPEKFRW